MLFLLPTTIAPVAGDDINGYAVAIAGHDGKTIFEFRPRLVRVVCQNTLSAAVGAGGAAAGSSASRTSAMLIRSAQVGTLVDSLLATMKATGESFARMAHRRLTPTEVVTFIESVFRRPPMAKSARRSPRGGQTSPSRSGGVSAQNSPCQRPMVSRTRGHATTPSPSISITS